MHTMNASLLTEQLSDLIQGRIRISGTFPAARGVITAKHPITLLSARPNGQQVTVTVRIGHQAAIVHISGDLMTSQAIQSICAQLSAAPPNAPTAPASEPRRWSPAPLRRTSSWSIPAPSPVNPEPSADTEHTYGLEDLIHPPGAQHERQRPTSGTAPTPRA